MLSRILRAQVLPLVLVSQACSHGAADSADAGGPPTGGPGSDSGASSSGDASGSSASGGSGQGATSVSSDATSGSTTADPTTGASATSTSTTDATSSSTGEASTGPVDERAFLHVDAWSVWWNDRTRCGAERTFLEICQRRGDACGLYEQAYAACDAGKIVYGQVGPEKQGEPLCQRSALPDVGGCVAADYDFEALRFRWYGAEWQGNWPVATLKVFPAGVDWTGGGELIALSNVPGAAQAAMAGIDNHGLGSGCAMLGVTQGDDKYLRPFGGFAYVEVPTGVPVTVAVMAATNFGDKPFQGCQRGAPTQDPWVQAPPGAQLGCVYVEEQVVFSPGRHYSWRYGQLAELPAPGPPPELVAGFALPEVGVTLDGPDACAL